jgi:hypothetical protein
VSTLRSALDELRGQDLRFLSDDDLESGPGELERAAGVIEAESARWTAEVERRGTFAREGHLSVTSWVSQRLRTGWTDAARRVRLARALEHMPATKEALVEGDVSRCAVDQMVSAYEVNPDQFVRVEETLVDAARTLAPRDLRKAVAQWKELADAEMSVREAEKRFERRGLHASPTFEGMVRVDGNLDPETGQTVLTALKSVVDDWMRSGSGDARTPAQRRADALGEICRQWLDRSDRPVVGGERPHLTVTVDLEALERRAGHRCELGDTGRITPETIRRLACDASVARVVMDGPSEPLDVGRRTPVVPCGLRRAVVVRDGHCRFPGCDRPQSWCDAHHVRHWADGGETKLGNLVLLCRPHHRAVHESFRVEVIDGRPIFTRLDGTPLGDRGPPSYGQP